MHVKLIDSSGATTYIECISAVWLGGDREMAEGYDGPEGLIHFGNMSERPDAKFIVVTPRHGSRFTACSDWLGAWVLSDTGKTVDNLLAQNWPKGNLPESYCRTPVDLPVD